MKKLLSLLLVTMMLLTASAVSVADEPIEITVAVSSLANGSPDSLDADWVHAKILEDTGISMLITLVDDYYTTMGARLAGDNMPDMFFADTTHMLNWVKEEALLDLTPYMDKELAPFFEWLGKTSLTSYWVDGKIYTLPKLYDGSKHQYCVTFRQDWLDTLKLSVPTTVQELYDVCYAFTYNDPDGDGNQNTYGLTSQKGMWAFDTIMGSYDTALGNYVIIRDGKVTNTLLQPGMLEGLQWCKKFVDEKLIDPDCVAASGGDKFRSGIAGMINASWSGFWKTTGQETIHNINPNAVTGFFTTLKSEVGATDKMHTIDFNTTSSAYAINADISEEKLQAIFTLINYLISEEGSNLVYFGLENVHWARNDKGEIVMTDKAAEANFTFNYQLFSREEAKYLSIKHPEAIPVFTETMAADRVETYNSLVREPEEMYLSDMELYIKEQLLNFIYGDRSLTQEEYNAFIQELNDVYDFDAYMEAANEQLTALGLVAAN